MKFWNLRTPLTTDELFSHPSHLWEAACEYFTWVDTHPWQTVKTKIKGKTDKNNEVKNDNETETRPTQRPYSFSGLCVYLDCPQSRFRQFKADCTDEAFLKVIARIEGVIETQLFEGVVIGIFSASLVSKGLQSIAEKPDAPASADDEQQIIWQEKKTYTTTRTKEQD